MTLLDRLLTSPSIGKLQQEAKQGHSLLVEGVWESPKALLAVALVRATGRSLLLLTGGVREDALMENLSALAPDLPLEFPAWETLPGEEIAPSPDLLGKRFETLQKLLHKKGPTILIAPLAALLQKVLPPKTLKPKLQVWKKGMELPFEQLPQLLSDLGYLRVPLVTDKGQFAVRGGIVDLFPTSAFHPFRLDFFGAELEQIRSFDPLSQKSIEKVPHLLLAPAHELPLLQKEKELATLFDYLGEKPLLFWDDLEAIEENYLALQKMAGSKSPLFQTLGEATQERQQIFCTDKRIEELSAHLEKKGGEITFEALGTTFAAKRSSVPFLRVEPPWEELDAPSLFLYHTETEKEEMEATLPRTGKLEAGSLTSGFLLADLPLALIPYADWSGRRRVRRQKWRSTHHTTIPDIQTLTPGDLVVHFHSGIGKYLGVQKQTNHLGAETEFFVVEYAEQSKLYVPLSQAHLLSRYVGAEERPPPLSQLGTKKWQTIRANAQAQIVGYAQELLQLYATRTVEGGFRFPSDGPLMERFEKEFPYIETEDQLLAIQALKSDMTSEKPMDRLVCGDVGYGKTEVAMRAAFKAIVDGKKQVALLVPTTVLAMQHFETFSGRMSGFPVRLGVVSRFRTAKENKKTLEQVAQGEIDLLIGTHRLLSQDVHFKNLGLLLIDEEQRFGVRAKEHLKKFKAGIDCLTLSATPIPRTLYLSLVHARDLSLLNTPPQDRLPIKTILAEAEEPLIQNALLREFARGGQAFFIHNRVETIHSRADFVQKLVPSAKIGVAHGQMDPDEIDAIFHAFKQGTLDLLFSTTLIENGIDIPNANTILIDRADTYGLADLYQLRGRVGRWNRSAYAYFLIPKNRELPEIARKRLNALIEANGFGGGMKIAMRDLEIRGAGDLLGVQQSGHVSQIGFHLYCKLLKKAVDALKKKAPLSFQEAKIESTTLFQNGRLPEDYIPEVSLRIELYQRLGEATTLEEVDALKEEIEDRFGPLPPPALWLYTLTRIKVFASLNHFVSLKFEALSLTAELQTPKGVVKKTLLLPKKVQTLEGLEGYVVKELGQQFSLKGS